MKWICTYEFKCFLYYETELINKLKDNISYFFCQVSFLIPPEIVPGQIFSILFIYDFKYLNWM